MPSKQTRRQRRRLTRRPRIRIAHAVFPLPDPSACRLAWRVLRTRAFDQALQSAVEGVWDDLAFLMAHMMVSYPAHKREEEVRHGLD